jgi:hypothetical protein
MSNISLQALNLIQFPSDETAVGIHRFMHYYENVILETTRQRGQKETERRKNFILQKKENMITSRFSFDDFFTILQKCSVIQNL